MLERLNKWYRKRGSFAKFRKIMERGDDFFRNFANRSSGKVKRRGELGSAIPQYATPAYPKTLKLIGNPPSEIAPKDSIQHSLHS
jgi:hypothetical protein